jgi:hypothetical protein
MQKFESEKSSVMFLLVKHDYALNEQKVLSFLPSKTTAIEERQLMAFDYLRRKNGDKNLKNEQMMNKFIIQKNSPRDDLPNGYYVQINPCKTFYKMTFCKKYDVEEEVRGMLYNSTIVKKVWKKKFNINIVRCGEEQSNSLRDICKKQKNFVCKEDLVFAQELNKMFNEEIYQLPVFNEIRETLEQQRQVCISELIKKYTEYFSKDCDFSLVEKLNHRQRNVIKLPPLPYSSKQVMVKDNVVSIHQKLANEALEMLTAMRARRAIAAN